MALTTAPQTLLVIPCFNEERRLRLSAFGTFLRGQSTSQVLFVNDGSTDATLPLLQQFRRNHPGSCSVGSLGQNCGKAEAVRQGLLAAINAGARFVGYWDADLAAPLRQVPLMEAVLARDPETHVVIGVRLPLLGHRIRRDPMRRRLGSIAAWTIHAMTGLPTRDTQCGAKLFRVTAELIESLKEPFHSRWLFDVELLLRLKSLHHGLEGVAYDFPLECWSEQRGSKVNWLTYARALTEMVRIRCGSRPAERGPASRGNHSLSIDDQPFGESSLEREAA